MDLLQITRLVAIDALRGSAGRCSSIGELSLHLAEAMQWLCRAQDAYPPGGVSIDYSLFRGWRPGYPETTGYIIPTFVTYANAVKRPEYLDRAIRMADWELSIQRHDGSFAGGPAGSSLGSFVFDTGQILFGLIEAHRVSGDVKYLDAAIRAADWLVDNQEPGGMWKRYTYNGIPHVYYTRVAWGLAELGNYADRSRFANAARRNIDWALTQQLPNGWFDSAGFTPDAHRAPYTHTIAYTVEGVLEVGVALGRQEYVDAAVRSADALLTLCGAGMLRARYDRNWGSRDGFSCLTGNSQIALILLRLSKLRGDTKYLSTAQDINRLSCRCQEIVGAPQVRGAISGSYPIWGSYQRFAFPNWAAKFFADALLMEMACVGHSDSAGQSSYEPEPMGASKGDSR